MLSGKTKDDLKLLHPLKASSPIEDTELGTEKLVNAVHLQNVPSSIFVIRLESIKVTRDKDSQFMNASSPIDDTLGAITMLES